MCEHFGDADRHALHQVLRPATNGETSPSTRLATSSGKGGGKIRGLAGSSHIVRWPPNPTEGSPLRHTNLFHVDIPNACWCETTTGRGDAAFLLAGAKSSDDQGGALVTWSMVCRPIFQGGLGIRHIQHTNAALLAKRVLQVMQPSRDILSLLLCQIYGHSMD